MEMKHLDLGQVEEICDNYINGNRDVVVEAVRRMNVLQVVDLLSNAKHFGVETHELIATLQVRLES